MFNKLLYSFCFIAFIVCVGFGILTRFSYVDDVSWVQNKATFITYPVKGLKGNYLINSIYYNYDVQHLDDVMNQSKVIVRVSPTNERKNTNGGLITKVHVLETLKGDEWIIRDQIYIHEPAKFVNQAYVTDDGYIIMDEGKEYILFLNPLHIPEGYKYKGDEAFSYMLTTTQFSKFHLERNGGAEAEPTRWKSHGYYVFDDQLSEPIRFEQIKNYELLVDSEETGKRYEEMREALWHWINL